MCNGPTFAMLGRMGNVQGIQASADFEHEPVIIESPFAGNVEQNIRYARLLMRDSLLRGEAPYASHLLYTQDGVLDDDVPAERDHGIHAGFAFRQLTHRSIIGLDLGVSRGMQYGIDHANKLGHPITYRAFLHGATRSAVDVSVHTDELGYHVRAKNEEGKTFGNYTGHTDYHHDNLFQAFDFMRAIWFPNALGYSLTDGYRIPVAESNG